PVAAPRREPARVSAGWGSAAPTDPAPAALGAWPAGGAVSRAERFHLVEPRAAHIAVAREAPEAAFRFIDCHMGLGQFVDETRRHGGGPGAAHKAVRHEIYFRALA